MGRRIRNLGALVLATAMAFDGSARDRDGQSVGPALFTPPSTASAVKKSTAQGVTSIRVRPTRLEPWANGLVPSGKDLTITSHFANGEQTVRVWYATSYQVYRLGTGQTLTFPDYDGPVMFTGDDLEVRAQGHDGIPLAALETKSVIPITDGNPTLRFYDYIGGPRIVELRGSNGVTLGEATILVTPFQTLTTTLDDLFPAAQRESLMQLVVPRGAGEADGVPSIPLSNANGTWYLLHFTPGTMVTAKNTDPTNVNVAEFRFYQENMAHTTLDQQFTTVPILNFGIATQDPLSGARTPPGAIRVQGNPVSASLGVTYSPLLVWDGINETDMAVARQGINNDARQMYDLSINGLHGDETLTVMNTSEHAVGITTHITGYKNGAQTSTYTVPLGAKENKSLSLSAVAPGADNIIMSIDNAPDGDALIPQAALIATKPDGEVDVGYRVARAAAKVTGEEYVQQWYDSISTQYMFFNNKESSDFLLSQGFSRDYGAEMLKLVYPFSGYPGTEAQYIALYKSLVDGSQGGQLYHARDPEVLDLRLGKAVLCSELEPQGNRTCTSIPDASIPAAREIARSFLSERSQMKPTEYSGTTQSGPSLSYNPTWATQDPN